MRSNLLEQAEKLPIETRLELVEAIWDTIAADAGVDALSTPQWHRDELERRLADLEANPDEGSSWEEVRARLQQIE